MESDSPILNSKVPHLCRKSACHQTLLNDLVQTEKSCFLFCWCDWIWWNNSLSNTSRKTRIGSKRQNFNGCRYLETRQTCLNKSLTCHLSQHISRVSEKH